MRTKLTIPGAEARPPGRNEFTQDGPILHKLTLSGSPAALRRSPASDERGLCNFGPSSRGPGATGCGVRPTNEAGPAATNPPRRGGRQDGRRATKLLRDQRMGSGGGGRLAFLADKIQPGNPRGTAWSACPGVRRARGEPRGPHAWESDYAEAAVGVEAGAGPGRQTKFRRTMRISDVWRTAPACECIPDCDRAYKTAMLTAMGQNPEFDWSAVSLAHSSPSCTRCLGLGSVRTAGRSKSGPCGCVLRSVFRVVMAKFRSLESADRIAVSRVDRSGRGARGKSGAWGLPSAEFLADVQLTARRELGHLPIEWFVWRFHFLLGADWKLCCRRLGVDRGIFFHSVYRVQTVMGRAWAESHGLYPLDEYFGGTVRNPLPASAVVILRAPGARVRRRLAPPLWNDLPRAA